MENSESKKYITLEAQRKHRVIDGIRQKAKVGSKSPRVFGPNPRVAYGQKNEEGDYCQDCLEPFINHSGRFPVFLLILN
jgi:hypothetical protein